MDDIYKNQNIIYKKYKDFKIKDKNDYNKYCFPKKFNLQNWQLFIKKLITKEKFNKLI